MAWVRLDDAAMTHPKVIGLSDRAFRLWVWGLAYCQQHLTDGYIPAKAVQTSASRVAAQLVEARLWCVLESGGWQVHDYTDWNDSRDEVNEKRSRARERMANVRGRTPREVPIRLVSDPLSSALEKKEEDPLETRFTEFWAAYPKKQGKGAAWNAWRKLHPDTSLLAQMIASIQAHRDDPQWLKEGGQFIPFPATWLNQRRFEDEPPTASPRVSEATSRLAQAVRDFSGSS